MGSHWRVLSNGTACAVKDINKTLLVAVLKKNKEDNGGH